MSFVNHNGLICLQDEALVPLQSRALRYGEGLIETMFFNNRKIRLCKLHYERLRNSLQTLHFPEHTVAEFEKEIAKTIIANQSPERGILRAEFFMNEALHELQYWIEFIPVKEDHIRWKKQGLRIGISSKAIKSGDSISHLKHSSRLVYVVAKHEAVEQDLDDILITNAAGNIVESTISNIFIVKDKTIFTPPLSEGCISGVMRRLLLGKGTIEGMKLEEQIIDKQALEAADEVFLTNAVRGIQAVYSINDKVYTDDATRAIFDAIGTL
jgi:branched-chain amino acid aminotransferase